MGIIRHILDHEERYPNKTALILNEQQLTYQECVMQTRTLSAALNELGVGVGSHVGLLLNNTLDFVVTLLAAADLGAIVVPLNTTISLMDFRRAIQICDIEFVIGQDTIIKKVFETVQDDDFPIPRKRCIVVGNHVEGCHNYNDLMNATPQNYKLDSRSIDEEQDYILAMTSGSTSAPKPIMFTQGTKIRRCFSAKESYGLTSQEIFLVATPLYHSISLRLILAPLILGATCVIMRKFTPGNWLDQVESNKVSFTIAVASQLEAIFQTTENIVEKIKTIRCLVSCCALLNQGTKDCLINELTCEFHECYGVSEVGVISDVSNRDPVTKVHSVGRAVSGVEIIVVDNERNPVAADTIGEIACKSLMQFSRYYKNELETKKSLVDGVFYTGDMGYMDNDGYLTFSGRKKELIITGGANVFPKDIESVLIEHPDVEECAVTGIPDKHFGEVVLAFIITKNSSKLMERELQRYCLHRLADVQRPLAYIFVDEFPRTGLGKVKKHELAAQYSDYDATANLRAIINNDIDAE